MFSTAIEALLPGLYASPPQRLDFAPSLQTRAFLLQRERGNLLVYASPSLQPGQAVDELGGIARLYVNHWHETSVGGDSSEGPLFVHAADRDAVAEYRSVHAAFSTRHTLDDDFEVVPTPGHTPGATAYLWDNGEHRFLFTGDTIYLRDGEWVAAVLGSSDRESYIGSLELIRALDFDVLVPWAATADRPYHATTDRQDTRRRVDAILRRVREGGDH
jgi:glyoxylase-like metal-dependent hydrolase (beta-lactamase superfamily II)